LTALLEVWKYYATFFACFNRFSFWVDLVKATNAGEINRLVRYERN